MRDNEGYSRGGGGGGPEFGIESTTLVERSVELKLRAI